MAKIWWAFSKRIWLTEHYYLIMPIIYMAMMFIPVLRPGLLLSLLMFFLFCKLTQPSAPNMTLQLFYLYFVYIVLSIQGYLYTGLPISLYFLEITNQLLPMLFFILPFSERFRTERFYRYFMYGIGSALILGLFFYFFPNRFYINYIAIVGMSDYEGNLDAGLVVRFQSFFGSTVTGTLGVISVIYSMFELNREDVKWQKKILFLIIYIVGVISALLSMQRSAMAGVLGVILGYYVWMWLYNIKANRFFVFFNIGVLCFVTFYSSQVIGDTYLAVVERLGDISSEAYGERDTQWLDTFEHSSNIILGTGLGSASVRAGEYTKYFISDGAIFKNIAEFGIVGFLIFLSIIYRCAIPNIIYGKYYVRELFIILILLFQSTGSNTINFQQLGPVFWLSLGVLSNRKRICKQ